MANGYNGKILRVNLSQGTTSVETLDEMFCRQHLGGAGFVAYYLMKEIKPKTDPLGPENKLFFMAGPVTGLPLSGSGRNCVGTKSPLTGGIAKSEVGGFWGAEMRHAGYDGIIIEGRAAKPVYLWIKDGEVSIKDAGHLWGKTTKETEEGIRKELGDEQVRVATIGPGGENMARFACVINDLKEAAGRGGTGAVMGSKNLKAIAVRGTSMPETADPDGIKNFRQWLLDNPKRWAAAHEYGTGSPASMTGGVAIGNMPIRNFRDGEFPDVTKIHGGAVKDTIRIGMDGCYACIVRCKKVVKVDQPFTVDPDYGGPEYETLAALGSCCGVNDLKAIAKGNELCNANSLDTISTGVTVAFGMECFENGLLTNKDTGGIELRFGNGEAMVKVIELIARREGIGDLLAEGSRKAAERIGQGAEKFAMNVKGLELPMHDPRPKAILGLGYSVNPHGADHCMNMHDTMFTASTPLLDSLHPLGILEPLPADDLSPSKVNMFRYWRQGRLLADSLVVCSIVPFTVGVLIDLTKTVTGWDTGMVELLKVSERTLTLFRMFNLREGLSMADDKLPARYFESHKGGPTADTQYEGREQNLNKARSYYYSLMGWDKSGVPTPETLEALDIAWASSV